MQSKIIGALTIAILCALLYIVFDKNRDQAAKISGLESDIKTALEKEKVYITRQDDSNQRELEYQKKIEEIQSENDRLNSCINAGTCGVRIKTKYIKVPATGTGTGTPDEGAARHCEISGQWYGGLRKAARENAEQLRALQAELLRRSAPDYCELKIN
jgi:hypothetical protein